MTRSRQALCEPLECRTLLAAVTITIYNDLNRNGLRNSNETGMANWGVIALEVRNTNGFDQRVSGRTDSAGRIVFEDNVLLGEPASARVYIEPNSRYYCTTNQRATSGWFGIATPDIAFGLTDVSPISGTLVNWYKRDDGQVETTPLANRRVYEDANRNARWDTNEKFAATDLDGNYTIWLRTGTHTLRVETTHDWTAPPGQKLVRSAVVRPYQAFPTFNATMIDPSVIDVAVGYTSAAKEVLGSGQDHLYALFRVVNQIYANSDTNTLINVAGIVPSGYKESGDIDKDLTRLQKRGDGYADEVPAERESARADLGMLLTSRAKTQGDTIGLAYEFAHSSNSDDFAFSVVTIDAFEDGTTLAHEIGHNLGAGHDAATIAADGSEPLEPYAQGYRFHAGANNGLYKDVMAYGSGRTLPFFSTPRYKYLGKPIGNAATADNSRIIKEIAPLVAEYR